jgi:hypothetical protein
MVVMGCGIYAHSKPLTNGFPPEAICKKLGKLDPAICELTYQKTYKFDLVRTFV